MRKVLTWAALVATVMAAAACSLPATTPSPTPEPRLVARLALPDGRAAIEKGATRLSLHLADAEGPFMKVGTVEDGTGHLTVHMLGFGGDTGRVTNAFVFGRAPEGATTVEGGPNAVAGAVGDGVFVLALTAEDVPPDAIFWTFRNAGGAVLEQGSGGRS